MRPGASSSESPRTTRFAPYACSSRETRSDAATLAGRPAGAKAWRRIPPRARERFRGRGHYPCALGVARSTVVPLAPCFRNVLSFPAISAPSDHCGCDDGA